MASGWRDLLARLRAATRTQSSIRTQSSQRTRSADDPRPIPPASPSLPSGSHRDPPEDGSLPEHDIELLSTQLRRIGHLDARPSQAEPTLRAALARLWAAGVGGEAVRLGTALCAALPDDLELQLQVAELLWRQRDGAGALPLLARVFASPAVSALAAPDPFRARPSTVGATVAADVDTLYSFLQRARLLRAEIRQAQGEYVSARTDLADVLISEWPVASLGAPALALARFRQVSPARPDGPTPGSLGTVAAQAPAGLAPTLMGSLSTSRYRLLRELGVGASGVVYVAHDNQLDCELALKRFHDALPDALLEAQLICALRHPGVLTLYDQDVEGRYLTMELCEGGSLRARLRAGGLRLAATLARMHELCAALAAVHAVAIEHGDIKPENLLFRSPARSLRPLLVDPEYGDLVISDFGIAQSLAAAGVVEPQRLRGTRAYLSPERLHGRAPSADGLGKSDLYSVGIVLFELLSGRLPQGPLGEAVPDAELDAALWGLPTTVVAELRPLLRGLLAADGADRPSARDAAPAFLALSAQLPDEATS